MTTTAIWVTIASSLISGLLGAIVSTTVYVHRDKKQNKLQTLKRFAANRFDLRGEEFSRALNEIFVVFNTHPEVMDRLSSFHDAVVDDSSEEVTKKRLIELYKSMCESVDVEYNKFSDSFFFIPFNTRSDSDARV